MTGDKVRYCAAWEESVVVSATEYEVYRQIRDEYPDTLSPDYDPYEWVCVEWAERDKTERDRVLENTGDWIDKLDPHDTPILKTMGWGDD